MAIIETLLFCASDSSVSPDFQGHNGDVDRQASVLSAFEIAGTVEIQGDDTQWEI